MRNKKIVKISIQGILVNVILVIFKSIIGFITNSISIVLDAVNNLTDVLSSVITIIGTKIASKKPDKEHPYGHGRAEYFASIIISIIILGAGLTALNESCSKIISGATANYDIISLIIIFVGIFVKFFFGNYVKNEGKKLNSSSLVASGIDAIGDSVIASSTFVGAIISYIWHISLEGYIGVIISAMIIKTAIGILKETVDQMIGVRADSNLTKKLRKLINSYDNVLGVYDLTLHNYGPNSMIATAHIDVLESITAKEIHRLTREIATDVYDRYGIIITIGIYASNKKNKYHNIKNYLEEQVNEYENILEIHGIYVDEDIKEVSFDVIFDFDEENQNQIINELKNKLKEKFPDYDYNIIMDKDISD